MRLARQPQSEPARERGNEPGRRARLAPGVLCSVLRQQRASDERAADIAERLGREELASGLDEREPGALVAPVESEPGEDLASEIRRADAVPGEAEAVVNAA